MNVLVTGGLNGFGKELVELLGEGACGVSRESGHNISTQAGRDKIVELSHEYDVFVNFVHRDFDQTRLLFEVGFSWERTGKKGHIFNIGSYATHYNGDEFQLWKASKFSLDLTHKQFRKQIENGLLTFNMTLLRFGLLDTEKNRQHKDWIGQGHTAKEMADILSEIYKSPRAAQISEQDIHWTKKHP